MALRTHFEQTKIGCPGVAEFTVQRTELNCTPKVGHIPSNSQGAVFL